MASLLTLRQRGEWFVVGFNSDRLTDPVQLEAIGNQLASHLRNLPLRGRTVLTFEGVDHVSSALIGLLTGTRAIVTDRLGQLVLCRVGPQLREMLRLTKLERQFEIRERLRDVVGAPIAASPASSGSWSPVVVRSTTANETQWID